MRRKERRNRVVSKGPTEGEARCTVTNSPRCWRSVPAGLGTSATAAASPAADEAGMRAAAKIEVLCWNNHFPPPGPGSGPADIRAMPKKCSLFRDGYNYEAAGAVHMRKLHWKHWGDRSAIGRGEFAQPMDVDDPWKPIKVRLTRAVDDCGRTVYSKAQFAEPRVPFRNSGFPIWTC